MNSKIVGPSSDPASPASVSPESIPLSPLSSPAPMLEGELLRVYKLKLDEVDRGLFRKVYNYIWDHLLPAPGYVEDVGVLSYFYLLPKVMRHFHLTRMQLEVLSFLWAVSNGGRKPIRTYGKRFSSYYYAIIAVYVKRGYLSRVRYDPSMPHSRSYDHYRFLLFTPEGRRYYHNVLQYMRRQVIQWHYNELDLHK